MQGVHRALGSWLKNIDRFIAPSDFLRRKVVANGLPGDAIVVKPHFVAHDPGPGDGLGGFVLFVGRLSGEKGVETLLRAWHHDRRLPPLRIVGDGPMANEVRQAAAALPHVHALGALTLSQVLDLLGAARFLIVPSICYESFASVVAESFAKGTPVIASGHGALAESVTDGYTGFHFPPGNHTELASTVVRGMGLGPHEYELQRAAARAAFERHYTAEHNYDMLCEIYRQAFAVAGAR
jgi:glycosyltransferase involved in cell wall biosynthesis